jgi:hypothetical protein
MKKMLFCVIPLMLVLMGCASGETAVVKTNSNTPGMDLDAAIREAAAQMGGNILGGTKVALISVASSSAQLSEYVISRLEAALVGGKKLVVVDRANLDKVREEQGFQLSGEVDDDSAKSIGKLLGAGAIVTGAFADLGDVYSLSLKAINIETATVAVSYPADIAKSTRIETLLASGGGAGTVARTAPSTSPQAGSSGTGTAAPPAPTYKVGDTGPAGGIIFYDKGNSSGGWRYLEAAPAETETAAFFAPETASSIVSNAELRASLKNPVGSGKINSQNLMETATTKGGGGFGWAVQICDELSVNGFDDWYLPSIDELNYLYGNVSRKGEGGFREEWYWSSSPDGNWRFLALNFTDGGRQYVVYNNAPEIQTKLRIRAVRQF